MGTKSSRTKRRHKQRATRDGEVAARELAQATRRSARTGTKSPGGTPSFKAKSRRIPKHTSRRSPANGDMRDVYKNAPETPNQASTRKHAPAAPQRKGGPGKRRPTPKKTAKR